MVVGLLRVMLPPHPDNEQASAQLTDTIGPDGTPSWVAVRPDTLLEGDEVTDYEIFPSPTRSPIFNAGKTSRVNVAHFMARLAVEDDLFAEWKSKTPVVYNEGAA